MKPGLLFCLLFLLTVNPLQSQPVKINNYLDSAAIFKESGEYEKAAKVLKQALKSSPNEQLYRYLARIEYLCGRSKSARYFLQKISNKDWLDFLYLGLVYEDLGKVSPAVKSYLSSRALRENSIALLRLGKIYRAQNQCEKAAEFFSALIKFDPSIRLAYSYLGECLYRRKDYEKTYEALAKAIGFYPAHSKTNQILIEVKKGLGEKFFAKRKETEQAKRTKVKVSSYQPQKNIPLVKVGLAVNLENFSFFCGGDFTASDNQSFFQGKKDKFYTAVLESGQLVLYEFTADSRIKSAVFNFPVSISSRFKLGQKAPFYILDITYGKDNFWQRKIDRVLRGDFQVISRDNKITLINVVSIEEYLYGVLAAEISANAHPQALKAQALAARTIAYQKLKRHQRQGFDLCADVHCQVYQGLSAETQSTKKAVDQTRGQILVYHNEPREIFYHSNCGGCLSADIFGEVEYLQEKTDSFSLKLPGSAYAEECWFLEQPLTFSSSSGSDFRWQRVYDEEDFLAAFGFPLENITAVIPKQKGDCFHYQELDVFTAQGQKSLKGDLNIRNYFDNLRSSAFKAEIKLSAAGKPKMLFFWGAGFGHGAGLSQKGAMNMADRGYNYKQILKHYYPKSSLKKLY